MLRKLMAVDLAPCEIMAKEFGFYYFPVGAMKNIVDHENVDLLETYVTVIEMPHVHESVESRNMLVRKINAIEECGANVLKCPGKKMYNGEVKQSDDNQLMTTVISRTLLLKPDFLVLFAGDGDYVPMVRELRHFGVRTEIVTRNSILASDLRRVAYSVIDIDVIFKHIMDQGVEPCRV
jgi:hypothetical protein